MCVGQGDMLPDDSAFKVQVHRRVVGPKVHYGYFFKPQKLKKKKLPKVYENSSSVHQKRNSYRKLAKDLERELERNTSFYQRWIMSHEKKNPQQSWLASPLTERKLNELRKEVETQTGQSRI